mmetsp:Transcript_20676/g.70026  ORF Transcript_20676/g.70026 Transcript_20676/m.70026 type:complete len:291 (+) Transcript_20676:360-1232(+)
MRDTVNPMGTSTSKTRKTSCAPRSMMRARRESARKATRTVDADCCDARACNATAVSLRASLRVVRFAIEEVKSALAAAKMPSQRRTTLCSAGARPASEPYSSESESSESPSRMRAARDGDGAATCPSAGAWSSASREAPTSASAPRPDGAAFCAPRRLACWRNVTISRTTCCDRGLSFEVPETLATIPRNHVSSSAKRRRACRRVARARSAERTRRSQSSTKCRAVEASTPAMAPVFEKLHRALASAASSELRKRRRRAARRTRSAKRASASVAAALMLRCNFVTAASEK